MVSELQKMERIIIKMFRVSTQQRQKEEEIWFDTALTYKLPCHTHQTSLGHSNHLRLAQTHTSTRFFNTLFYLITAIMPLVVEPMFSSSRLSESELVRFLHYFFPQLKDHTRGHNRKTSLGMDALPAQYEYAVRARQPWINGNLDPRRMMPQPPKKFPTAYYLEQRALARPWVGPVPDWAIHYDPPPIHPLFQRCVLVTWAYLITIASTAAEPSRQLALRLWSLPQLIVTWGVVFPAKVVASIFGGLQWDLVTAAIVALWIARWLPGMAGEIPQEAVKPDEPVYILMVPGGERLSKLALL
jgi:hypothetical protein